MEPKYGTKRLGEEEVLQVELLPGARFRIRPEPGAAAWWGDPPGSLTIRVVHSLSGAWALGFQPLDFSPGRASTMRESN